MFIYLACLWTYIVLLSVVPFIDFKPKKNTFYTVLNIKNGTTIERIRPRFYYYNHQPEWVVFMLLFNAALPLVLIILCYVYIIRKLKNIHNIHITAQQCKQTITTTFEPPLLPSLNTDHVKRKPNLSKQREVVILTFALAITYGICWTPSIVFFILQTTCEACFPEDYQDSKVETIVSYSIKYLAYSNAVFSPLIYCFYSSEFRKALKWLRKNDHSVSMNGKSSSEPSFLISMSSWSASLGRNKKKRYSRGLSVQNQELKKVASTL